MKKILALLLIPCMFFIVGCSSTKEKTVDDKNKSGNSSMDEGVNNPPDLRIQAGDSSEKATLQKYDWTYEVSDNNTKNEIKTVMDEQEVAKSVTAITVGSAQEINLDFESKPESYTVKMILPNNKDLEVKDNTVSVPVPSTIGKATFRVDCKYKQGTVTYMFNLDIQG